MSPLWSESEEWLDGIWPDAALRGVNPPPELMARLGEIPVESDADLDRLICDVPIPAAMIGRLCQIGAARDQVRKRRGQVEQKAVAASLIVMAWCSYAAALIMFWAADYPFARATAESWLQTAAIVGPELDANEGASLAILGESDLFDAPRSPEELAANRVAAARQGTTSQEPAEAESPPGEELLAFHWSNRYASDFDFSSLVDTLADELRPASTAAIPQGPGFDHDFLARTGVLPRIDPRYHPMNRPPLTSSGDGFEFARQCLGQGALPPPEAIRTEDFLAAVEFGFDRPKTNSLALSARGGRTAWPAPRRLASADRAPRLLQLGVQTKGEVELHDALGNEIVAHDVRMSVRFNPQTVLSYRLCGHEPASLSRSETPAQHFAAGQSATAVYELELQGDGDAEVASVVLEWRDAASGEPRIETRKVFVREFAASFRQAEESV
ncbi:MAG TPA: YfbK domain-containing protein, partial [Pirellulales bacterium]|nr:YfbK domain-containing protein [Pirellulales bacterium]